MILLNIEKDFFVITSIYYLCKRTPNILAILAKRIGDIILVIFLIIIFIKDQI